jgi:hypothetical protein
LGHAPPRFAGLVVAPLFTTTRILGEEVIKEIHMLKPGERTWDPERSPQGALAVVVSIPGRVVHVYRNDIRVASPRAPPASPATRHRRGSTYTNAPTPNMNRLTWDGVALHAGNLPG